MLKKKKLLNFRNKKYFDVLILFFIVNVFLLLYLLKPKKISSSVECFNESNNFSDDEEEDGCPLPVVFDSLIGSDPEYSSVSVIRQLKEKFYLYPLSQNIGRYLILFCNLLNVYFPYFTHVHLFLGS